jgi:hypothetical protein
MNLKIERGLKVENSHLLLEMSQLRHRDMVQEAENERLIRQLEQNQPNLLQQVGQRLAAARAHLKAQTGTQFYRLLFGPRALRQQKKTVASEQ